MKFLYFNNKNLLRVSLMIRIKQYFIFENTKILHSNIAIAALLPSIYNTENQLFFFDSACQTTRPLPSLFTLDQQDEVRKIYFI